MKIQTNMHKLIFLAACVLFTTTECITTYQHCPAEVVQGTIGVVTCVGYTASPIAWELKSGQSAFSTVGECTSSAVCTLRSTYDNVFTLAAISGSSSQLNLTTRFTATLKDITLACDGEKCNISIVAPPTTVMTTTELATQTETEESSSPPGTEESPSSSPETPADTETSLTMSNNNTTPAVSTQSPTTTEGKNATNRNESPTTTEGKDENATNRNESPHEYVAVYVGAGFAGLVVIIVVVAVVVLRMRSSKKKARTMTNDQATNGATSARGRAVPREDTRM